MVDHIQLAFNLMNIITAVLVMVSSIVDLFHLWGFEDIIMDMYSIAFSVIILRIELVGAPTVVEYMPILKTWLGRSLTYIFLGAVCVGHYVDNKYLFPLVSGIFILFFGVLSFLLHILGMQLPIPLVTNVKGGQVDLESHGTEKYDTLESGADHYQNPHFSSFPTYNPAASDQRAGSYQQPNIPPEEDRL